jgi:hypothetical protein
MWCVSVYFFDVIPYKYHENPFRVSRDIPHQQTDLATDGRTVTHNKYSNRVSQIFFGRNYVHENTQQVSAADHNPRKLT